MGPPRTRPRGLRVSASRAHSIHTPTHTSLPFRLAQDGVTGLFIASEKGHVEVARLLLDRGAAVDAATTVRDGEREEGGGRGDGCARLRVALVGP